VVCAHFGVRRALLRPNWAPALRAAARVATGIGALFTVVGLWVVWHKGALDGFRVERPWLLAAGVTLLGYGPWVLRQLEPEEVVSWVVPKMWRRYAFVIAASVVVACTFWSFSAYAAKIGGAESRDLVENDLTDLPVVIVYSAKDLQISADGVNAERLTNPDSAYLWKYTGLRLLVMSSDRYFLLPIDWDQPGDVAIVLADSADLRVEFQRKDAKP
jgi:hypothetical protein